MLLFQISKGKIGNKTITDLQEGRRGLRYEKRAGQQKTQMKGDMNTSTPLFTADGRNWPLQGQSA